jgi:hypothetical protein
MFFSTIDIRRYETRNARDLWVNRSRATLESFQITIDQLGHRDPVFPSVPLGVLKVAFGEADR